MTGWNLPPGCNVNDIPGNSREDGILEAIEEGFYDNKPGKYGHVRFTPQEWKYLGSKNRTTHLEDIIWKAIEYGMDIGYKQCLEEEREAEYMDQFAKEYNENN